MTIVSQVKVNYYKRALREGQFQCESLTFRYSYRLGVILYKRAMQIYTHSMGILTRFLLGTKKIVIRYRVITPVVISLL